MERWSDKVAVVTGASSGIGEALTLRLANLGLVVVGLARRVEMVEKLVSQVVGKGSLYARKCDISNTEDIEATFQWIEEKFGGIDILINNAGTLNKGGIFDVGGLSDEAILSTINVNFCGLVMCSRKAIASMTKRNFDGHIVNINSIAGHYIPFSLFFNVYPATKHAVTAFTATLLNELATVKSKIKVTSVSPGLVKTQLVTDDVGSEVPILQPDDVVDAIVFILSTPPNVNISELSIQPTSEIKL
ncbi:unnamed protein product, partial [Brenthis ino]